MKPALLTWLWHAAVILLVLATAGLGLALLGVIPIPASSGHFRATAIFFQLAKERSVATHTLGLDFPEPYEPWLVLKGAGHYETGCKPCHGSPEFRSPVIARGMTPHPPDLGPRVPGWEPKELFYMVKHGIKFTGMPAWPALGRDDEVRAMVAFLLELPKLDGPSYRRLVHGEPTARSTTRAPLEDLNEPAAPAITTSCARCHGARGEGRGNAAFPKLAGQRRAYLFNALEAYARGERHSGMMEPLAAPLSHAQWAELASYYAKLPPAPPEKAESAARAELGRKIAHEGLRGQGVPACIDCHGPGEGTRNAAYPLLAGQYADYLLLQLELFKNQRRGGSPYVHIMYNVGSRLRPEQMRAVAEYYASLSPSSARPE